MFMVTIRSYCCLLNDGMGICLLNNMQGYLELSLTGNHHYRDDQFRDTRVPRAHLEVVFSWTLPSWLTGGSRLHNRQCQSLSPVTSITVPYTAHRDLLPSPQRDSVAEAQKASS